MKCGISSGSALLRQKQSSAKDKQYYFGIITSGGRGGLNFKVIIHYLGKTNTYIKNYKGE